MDNILVKKTGSKGEGVFAARDFKKGEFILDYNGKIVEGKDADNIPDYWCNHLATVGLNKYILFEGPAKYINHSCSPNVYDKNKKVYTMKSIKKGDELCFDYSISGIDDWKMKCKCGSKNCRKIISGVFFKLPKALQKKYIPYLDSWFKKSFSREIDELKDS